jgi:PAS domain S-box-containing protein
MTPVTPMIAGNEKPAAQDANGAAEDSAIVEELRRELAESEARFAALAETVPHIVWSATPNGVPDYYNPRWYDLTGMPAGPAKAADWTAQIHPDDIERVLADWRRCVETGEPLAVECRIRDKEAGTWRWFLGRAQAVRNEAGEIVRWFGSGTDIDEVVRGREAVAHHGAELERTVVERTAELVEAHERLAHAIASRRDEETARRDLDALYTAYIDNTSDGVFVVTVEPDGGIAAVTVNSVFEQALHVRRERIRGLQLHDLLAQAAADGLAAQIRACVASGKPLRYEETVRRRDAERFYEMTLVPVGAADGRSSFVVGSARDLTERRNAEQQLRQAQKMEALGQLTGGIAHDFNNLLQVVKGNLDLLAIDLAGAMTPVIERRLRDAMAGAERGAKLTRQLLAFSRRQPLTPKPTDVGELVASMADLLDRTLGETIELEITREPGGWTALVDPAQLENAVLNLAINARDAMPDGGRLTISVNNLSGGPAGDQVEIAVADAGVGMSPAVLARVFEPFFSTKPEGRGTGLGLPQVQGFIEQSNGAIDIESRPGAGTTVRLRLPRSAAPAAVEEKAPAADARGRGERILVVEDDEDVRRAVADMLTAMNYRVATAGTTQEAAARLASDEPFDLLLSDVVMPGAPTPPELARSAIAKRPALKVLFMSGYAEDVIVHQGRIDADVHLIEKPYRQEELSAKIRRLLDAAPSPAAASAGPRRVLLVEDEPLIAMGVAELLASFGYDVVETHNATEAQAALRAGPPIDVLLTDLGLPDMEGIELAEWCRTESPGVPIVFSTGRSDFEAPASLAAGGPVGVVTKPFNALTLRRALEASAPSPR